MQPPGPSIYANARRPFGLRALSCAAEAIYGRPRSSALAETAHVALHASFGKLELGSAVGTRAREHLLHPAEDHLLAPPGALGYWLRYYRSDLGLPGVRQQLLLNPLLLLHPAFDGDA